MEGYDVNDQHDINHPQCNSCWFAENGIRREPHRIKDPQRVRCCYCGKLTNSGIYRRAVPRADTGPLHCPALNLSIFRRAPEEAAQPADAQ